MIFGELPIEPRELVTELMQHATATARKIDPGEEDTAWTTAVKLALDVMARDRGFTAHYSNRKKENSEFLLDLVWWKQDNKSCDAVLGMESEWRNADKVREDFDKLLQFKSPLKLMIFTADTPRKRREIHAKLREGLHSFAQHVRGECYVFTEFTDGRCYSYRCDIKKDGMNQSAEIVPLDENSAKALES